MKNITDNIIVNYPESKIFVLKYSTLNFPLSLEREKKKERQRKKRRHIYIMELKIHSL